MVSAVAPEMTIRLTALWRILSAASPRVRRSEEEAAVRTDV